MAIKRKTRGPAKSNSFTACEIRAVLHALNLAVTASPTQGRRVSPGHQRALKKFLSMRTKLEKEGNYDDPTYVAKREDPPAVPDRTAASA